MPTRTCKTCLSFKNDTNKCSSGEEILYHVETARNCRGYIQNLPPADSKGSLDPELKHLLDNTPPTPPEWTYKISRESLAETLLIELVKRENTNIINMEAWAPKLAVSLVDNLIEELNKEQN